MMTDDMRRMVKELVQHIESGAVRLRLSEKEGCVYVLSMKDGGILPVSNGLTHGIPALLQERDEIAEQLKERDGHVAQMSSDMATLVALAGNALNESLPEAKRRKALEDIRGWYDRNKKAEA